MMDRVDAHHRTRPLVGGVVAGELAERAFRQRLLLRRQQLAFEDDLGMRRQRQAGLRPGDHLDRRILDRAGELVFRLPGGKIFEARDEQRRVHAVDHRERTGFSGVPVFLGDDRAVPAEMVELHGDLVPGVHLHAIDRGVDPAAVGIAHDHDRARADVGPAVLGVPHRRRQLAQIDRIAAHAVLQECRVLHRHRLVVLERLALRHPGLQCVERPQRRIEPERQRRALRIGGGVGEDAEARRIALDAVEQQRRALRQSGRDLGDAAELDMRIGIHDAPQRAELFDLGNEFAQILVHPPQAFLSSSATVARSPPGYDKAEPAGYKEPTREKQK